MKKKILISALILLIGQSGRSQTLTLVSGKRIYDHHSSILSSAPYGYYNSNASSGYDFVNHTSVPSGNSAMVASRDMVEHNGFFGHVGNNWGLKFGFTDSVSNIGNFGYKGNNLTKFYLNNTVSFSSLNTVNDLIAAYDSTHAVKLDTAVVTGNVYIARIRNSDMYVAMRITNVSNLNTNQIDSLYNNLDVMASVYFDFEYKYGTFYEDVTGIKTLSNQQNNNLVKVYPNPSNGDLNFSSSSTRKNYKITNMIGEEVRSGSVADDFAEQTIDIRTFPSGIYFVKFSDTKGLVQTTRFVKR